MTGNMGIERVRERKRVREGEVVLIQLRQSIYFKEGSERDGREEREGELSTQKRYLISLG